VHSDSSHKSRRSQNLEIDPWLKSWLGRVDPLEALRNQKRKEKIMTKKSVRQLAQDIAEQQKRAADAQAAYETERAHQQLQRSGGTKQQPQKGSNGKGPQ
jgi:hypothetical protein